MNCLGQFTIANWDETTLVERCDNVKTSHATIKQKYSGDIVGESEIEFLMSYQSKTQARFTGFETFTGVIQGKRGAITFQHSGTFENGVASSHFESVALSATGELASMAISGSFRSGEAGVANYQCTLNDC